ncbi:MAG: hypothetical protein AAFR21_14175 [Pseudomonadota bacterium]
MEFLLVENDICTRQSLLPCRLKGCNTKVPAGFGLRWFIQITGIALWGQDNVRHRAIVIGLHTTLQLCEERAVRVSLKRISPPWSF